VGVLVTRRRHGACRAVQWDEAARRYRCGLVAETRAFLPAALRPLAPGVRRLALRLIASGVGCDSDATIEPD
jgi:hypothetical protein